MGTEQSECECGGRLSSTSDDGGTPWAPAGRGKERSREKNTGKLLQENFQKGRRIRKWKEFERGVCGKLELREVIDFGLKKTVVKKEGRKIERNRTEV